MVELKICAPAGVNTLVLLAPTYCRVGIRGHFLPVVSSGRYSDYKGAATTSEREAVSTFLIQFENRNVLSFVP